MTDNKFSYTASLALGAAFIYSIAYTVLFMAFDLFDVLRARHLVYMAFGENAEFVIRMVLRHGFTALCLVIAVLLYHPQLRAIERNDWGRPLDRHAHKIMPLALACSILWTFTANTMAEAITVEVLSRDVSEHIRVLLQTLGGATYLIAPRRALAFISAIAIVLAVFALWRKLTVIDNVGDGGHLTPRHHLADRPAPKALPPR